MAAKEKHIDPICGMKGTIPAHGHYFCSEHCIKKYEKQHNISPEPCPSCATLSKKPWYKERLYIITIVTVALLILSYVIPLLHHFYHSYIEYLRLIWWAILLGFFIGGIIDYFIPRQYIEKYLSRHQKRTIIYAIIFGFFMSACSHGILAIAIALYKKGANTSSVIAFLLASPWANLPITFLLFGFFGLKAAFVIISAFCIALTTGLIYQVLERRGWVECQHCVRGQDVPVHTTFSIIADAKQRWKNYSFNKQRLTKDFIGVLKGSWALTKMVMWWLLVGLLLAAFAQAFIPTHFFEMYLGPTLLGLLITLLFATIIEVCSEGSAPLAFEIYNQTGAFGNSFVFLMAGVVTDYTEIGLIWSNIGKKAAVCLPLITVPQVLLLGFLFNTFL